MMEWYTKKCIDIYFGTWMKAEEKVRQRRYFPWLVILANYDYKYLGKVYD